MKNIFFVLPGGHILRVVAGLGDRVEDQPLLAAEQPGRATAVEVGEDADDELATVAGGVAGVAVVEDVILVGVGTGEAEHLLAPTALHHVRPVAGTGQFVVGQAQRTAHRKGATVVAGVELPTVIPVGVVAVQMGAGVGGGGGGGGQAGLVLLLLFWRGGGKVGGNRP